MEALWAPLPLPAEWLDTAWRRDTPAMEQLLAEERQRGVTVARLVLLAHGFLLAGESERGDDLILEADRLAPQLALVPDLWGLWPQAAAAGSAAKAAMGEEAQTCHRWAEAYRRRRHREGAAALARWREQIWAEVASSPAERWQRLLEADSLELLAVILSDENADPAELRMAMEPLLVQAIGEEVVERHPQQALLFWSGISRRCPSWDYARLKTADLCLASGQWQRSAAALAAATEEQRRNPWLHDIEARLAMAQGRPADALRCWETAIAAASGDGELVELLRQRRREAEWEVELTGGGTVMTGPSGDAELDRFAARLEEVAQRFGVLLPQGAATTRIGEAPSEPEGFAAFLDEASGRLALAG